MKTLIKNLCLTALLLTAGIAQAQVPKLSSYPSAAAVIFLDFDGQTVSGTSWSATPLECLPAPQNTAQITEIFNRVSEDFRPFNVNITTDSTVFLAAPNNRRMRVIVTPTHEWYGNTAGGIAYPGSFTWINPTPCFVFSAMLNNNVKNIAEACSHEAGHTLGLAHQSAYNASCVKTEYYTGQGFGEIGWAPIMGSSYARNLSTWHYGTSSSGCSSIQDDVAIITGTITNGVANPGLRPDDHTNTHTGATPISVTGNNYAFSGLVNQRSDVDVFSINVPLYSNFRLNAVPYNVAAANAGANIDIQVRLLNFSRDTVGSYNPTTLLNTGIDTNLNAGTYYLVIDGVGNINTTDYGSLGFYNITGSVNAGALPLRRLELNGAARNGQHQLSWLIDADERVTDISIETSTDGRSFTRLTYTAPAARQFAYKPLGEGTISYRLKVSFDNGRSFYSNITALRTAEGSGKTELVTNVVDQSISISSKGNYNWQLVDVSGKTVKSGKLTNGMNTINSGNMASGIYFLKMNDGTGQWMERLMKL